MIHPAVRDQLLSLTRGPAFQELLRSFTLQPAARHSLSGLTQTAKALYLTLFGQSLSEPVLVVTDTNRRAEQLLELLNTFHDLLRSGRGHHRPLLLPAHDVLPGQGLSPHSEIREQRATGLYRMATGQCSIVVTPIGSALLRVHAPAYYRQLVLRLKVNEEIGLDDLIQHLNTIGYERREPVEMEGEYSLRGGIFDVFPAEHPHPIRIEFFGDTIESMRRFDPATQRSIQPVDEVSLLPLEEEPRERALLQALAEEMRLENVVPGEIFPGWEFCVPRLRPLTHTLESLLPGALVVWDEPDLLQAASERLWKKIDTVEAPPVDPEMVFHQWGELQAQDVQRKALELRELSLDAAREGALEIPSRPSIAFRNNMRVAVDEARRLLSEGYRVMFCGANQGEVERLGDIFGEYSLPFETTRGDATFDASTVYLVQGAIRRGVLLPEARIAILGFEDLFETAAPTGEAPRARSVIATFTPESLDLQPGDYVVHAQHGIGRFIGIRQIKQDDSVADFMLVEYAGEARLYVPLTRLDLIQKYRTGGDTSPSLDKLGGVTWSKTKSRIKARMRDMADELLKLYAARKTAQGFAFSPDSNWQREFEESFPYTATRDQLQATTEIKRDMESDAPMDRLLCGDVGFGKTEVAMRAAFKVLGDGKQVAVLAPTTVLALQHFETFKRRFAAFPARIEMLSRFRNAKETRQVIDDLALGKVDVLVGTHRILSKDVEFPDLGILIVDEEQRFGVRHKERLKQLRQSVDVLTMSATPIPRTLHMALLGLRDMSVIETPPKDRLAVHTVVAKFDAGLIRTAIEQELSRGGQVYFVHNRIESIFSRAAAIQELVPGCRIGVGHGQMDESELEKVLLAFMSRETDVFVCTKIVENGLDIPLANTMIIESAHTYGLSELYQLRGRVGRSNRRAYAYLLVPEDVELTEVARKRLAALKEFSDLGSGFKIAALDLELRGAGNLLGGEQHGHIVTVGYETYLKLLDETARELRGEQVAPEIHSNLNLGLEIRIPNDYISDEQQRLRAYKRIADAGDPVKAEELLAEFADRYGAPPEPVRHLLLFSQIKTRAQALGIENVERRGTGLNFKFHPQSAIDPRRLMQLVADTSGAQFTPAGILRLPIDATGDILEQLQTYLGKLA